MKIMVNSTPLALWYDVVHDAERSCDIVLAEELESYLIFLLMRYLNKPEMAKKIMASEFMKAAQQQLAVKQLLLQSVGDECLLFSGLFPQIAEKRRVKIAYFVKIGQSAYLGVSQQSNDLYDHLAQHFVVLMDILQTVRQFAQESPDLLPLQAYDLWHETGSQRALSRLKQYTEGASITLPAISTETSLIKIK